MGKQKYFEGNWAQGPMGPAWQLRTIDITESIEFLPITLTDDWWRSFGFKHDGIGHLYLHTEEDTYTFVDRGDKGYMLVIYGEEHKETYVKHVHRLQNLWYELNDGEILTTQNTKTDGKRN